MGLKPIKIGEKGAALSCAEYDANIERVLDRSNHTGKQSCETLSDLGECLSESEIIVEINKLLEELKLSIEEIENSLSEEGELADKLAALRGDLFALIQESAADILELQQGGKTAEAAIVSLNANLESLTDLVEYYNTTQQNQNKIQDTQIKTINSQLITQINTVTTLRSDLLAEITARIAGDTTLRAVIQTEASSRIQADEALQELISTILGDQVAEGSNLISLINTKAPKESPTFEGSPANFSKGAVVPDPSTNAVGTEVINASWFNKRFTTKTTDLTNQLNLKAPKSNPEFSGTFNSSGPSYFNNSLYTVDPSSADKSNRVPNTNWIWGHINNLNNSIAGKASLYNPVFIANVEVKGEATFQGTSRFNYLAHFSQGARVTISNTSDPLHATNAEYVQFYVKGLQGQITDLQKYVTGGNSSIKGATAFVAFNARTGQIYQQYNVAAVTRKQKGLHSIKFSARLDGTRPIVVGTCSRYPADDQSWGTAKASPHVMIWADRALPAVDGNSVDIFINSNEGSDEDRVDPDYVAIVAFS